MVASKLDNTIHYLEVRKIDEADKKKEADLYEIEVDNVDIIIAVGNAKNTFSNKNVTYFPIYMVKNDNTVIQIGVYEVFSKDVKNYLDNQSNLLVEKMDDPLIYSFITKQMLEDERFEKEIVEYDEDKEEASDEIPNFRQDIFILTQGIPRPKRLTEETRSDAKAQRDKYMFKDGETWVETFMENSNYYIVDNEGNGDCLFATVRDGFAQIGQQTTVQKLRKKLAEEATQELFMNYKQQYENAKLAITKDTENIKELEIQYNKYRQIFSESLDRNEKKQAIDAAKKLSDERERVINEKRISQQIANEFEYMKDINSLDQFKKKITTCEFWGETWALSTMERILRVKFILLSEEAWKDKDTNNVVVCGQLNDRILEQQGEFKPDYYFILDFNGYHYKLVGYKKKQIFKFQEIPYDIKKKVAEKCMEKNAGVFSLIPDFISFQKGLNAGKPIPTPKFEELSEAKIRGLYDDDIQFVFYKSSPHKIPGQGNNEKLNKEVLREYSQLASIKNWRKKLDNTWLSQFTLDGHQWNSVEHYYQGSKFKGSPDFYLSFTAESGTKLSKDPELAKAAASTSGKLKGEQIRPKEVTMDSDLTGKQKEKSLRDALEAKFMQNDELKQLLKLTKRAKLLHYKKSKDPELAETLMFVRDKLIKSTD